MTVHYRIIIALLQFTVAVAAMKGFDAIAPISLEKFKCLKENGFDFFIGRVFRSNGKVDDVGIKNILNAKNANWTDVGGYVFPCPTSSCISPEEQIGQTIRAMEAYESKVDYLWIDVEIHNWPNDKKFNRDFISRMVKAVQQTDGYKVGIYSNNHNWETIVGLDWQPYGDLPLWWARYNKKPGFETFQPFGGWKKPLIHQYQGTTNGPCGVEMDLNYKD